jgi:spermidine/putrescine transport system substrate-binding protein
MIAAMYLGIPEDRMFVMDDKELAELKKALIAEKSSCGPTGTRSPI